LLTFTYLVDHYFVSLMKLIAIIRPNYNDEYRQVSLMEKYKYLIIGGGMTADSAVQGIRSIDGKGTIGLISLESDPPYDRPPLSKGLWTGDVNFEEIWRPTQDAGAILHLGQCVQSIDPARKQVTTRAGMKYQYQKLLLATGGTPRRLPQDIPDVIYYRTLQDYKILLAAVEHYNNFCVIGGGFIGSELAAALNMQGKMVTMIFPEIGVGGRVFPTELSNYLASYYRKKGVTIRSGELVTSMKKTGKTIHIQTNRDLKVTADCVIAGIGIIPNINLAEAAGLSVDNGIMVDQYLRTSESTIFAAGDVANFLNSHLGKRIRVEHEDNANVMGELAGQNMAGEMSPYEYLPSFYSDLFDIGYEAVGELDARLPTILDWKEDFHEGVIYYLDQNRIRGIILWNIWDQIDPAREIIAQKEFKQSSDVLGLLPQNTSEQ
jgi:3-phenylpropionate/trans-cinnamate dioxygenase ferredoxin reductase subunit